MLGLDVKIALLQTARADLSANRKKLNADEKYSPAVAFAYANSQYGFVPAYN